MFRVSLIRLSFALPIVAANICCGPLATTTLAEDSLPARPVRWNNDIRLPANSAAPSNALIRYLQPAEPTAEELLNRTPSPSDLPSGGPLPNNNLPPSSTPNNGNPSPGGSNAEVVQPQDREGSGSLGNLPKSSKDEADVTKVPEPRAAQPPKSLDELRVPNLQLDNIGSGDVPDDVAARGLPEPIPLPLAMDRGLNLAYSKKWVNPGFTHQPLYFEDVMLERHGHERFPALQPLVSGARFFGSIPLFAYQWTLQGPLEERSTLGNYRPGSAAPLLRQRLPYDRTAIRNEIIAGAAATALAAP